MAKEIIPIKKYIEQLMYDSAFPAYKAEINMQAWEIAVHAFGLYPEDLISNRRPNETAEMFEYRKSIYQPITKKYVGKVITELNKIRRSTDWSIIFDRKDVPTVLLNDNVDNTLENYVTNNFPDFTSITNWLFSLVLPIYLIDANAFILVLPENPEGIKETELINPVPEIVPSDRIMYYIPKEIFIYKDIEHSQYWELDEEGGKHLREGDILHVVTPLSYVRYEQVSSDYKLKETVNYTHNLGYIPVTQTGGIVKGKNNNRLVYRSRISDMIPDLNEAVREYSDIQAESVNVIFSERWEMAQGECRACNGTGEVKQPYGAPCEPCKKCNGTGALPRSPFTKLVIKPQMTGEDQNIPIPPAGYIEKSTEIITIQDKRISKHISDALGAINMSFLEDVPLSESGIAKQVDRDALNTFVHSIAEDIVRIADTVVKHINDLRYNVIVPDKATRDAMLPYIVVPEVFDLLNAEYILKELSDAQNSKVSAVIIRALNVEYAAKKFNSNPDVRKELELTLMLDPLSGISDEDKIVRLSAKGITLKNYVISSNISDFISKALFQYGDDFYTFQLDKQKEILDGYAVEVMNENSLNIIPDAI